MDGETRPKAVQYTSSSVILTVLEDPQQARVRIIRANN